MLDEILLLQNAIKQKDWNLVKVSYNLLIEEYSGTRKSKKKNRQKMNDYIHIIDQLKNKKES